VNTEPVRRRRRGAELEAALLEAAWEELQDVGFANITMESFAARAGTGVAVLYRRWANKDEVLVAALGHYIARNPVLTPDTGTLRGDLVELLRELNSRAPLLATLTAMGVFGLSVVGQSPMQIREQLLKTQRTHSTEVIFRRAQGRGEVDLTHVPQTVLDLPTTLARHDVLMTLKPLSEERISEIVDEIEFPLLRSYQALGESREGLDP
jgi:AcrR family transcriptional regulator